MNKKVRYDIDGEFDIDDFSYSVNDTNHCANSDCEKTFYPHDIVFLNGQADDDLLFCSPQCLQEYFLGGNMMYIEYLHELDMQHEQDIARQF